MPFAVEVSGLLGLLVVLLGSWGILAPKGITRLVTRLGTRQGLRLAVAFRLVLGLALWFAATESRAPLLLQVLGLVAIVSAILIATMGVARFQATTRWWSALSATSQRLWSSLAVAFGAIVLWALLPVAT